MKEQPEIFDEFCVNLTEVAKAGTLDTVLDRLAEFKDDGTTQGPLTTPALSLYRACDGDRVSLSHDVCLPNLLND